MAIEQLPKNFSLANLSGSITDVATTLTVSDATKFPTAGVFRILIGTEIIKVTGVAGAVFTAARGDGGTTAAAHLTGATVTGIYTKEMFEGLIADLANVGSVGATYATNFSAGRAGRVFVPNDAPWVGVDDGTSVNYLGHPQYRRMYPLDASLMSWVNQGGASESTANGIVTMTAPAVAGDNFRMRVKARPSAPPWTVEAFVMADIYPINFHNVGLVAYDSVSGKFTALRVVYNTNITYLNVCNLNSVTSFNADIASLPVAQMQGIPPHWLRMQDDGTNLIFSYSVDGYTFRPISPSVGRTSFMPSGADKVGYFCNPVCATLGVGVSVYSWKES
jgi:hypothetical protein